jgi:hypothetical protein
VKRRLGLVWGLLVLNVLTYTAGQGVIPLPSVAGKAITQGSLVIAFLVALTINRRLIVRPNVFLCLVSLLAVGAVIACLQPVHLSTYYRTFRLVEFVATLWLLTPWWGRRDLLLARYHLAAMSVVLGSVVLGAFMAPGQALSGRLGGVIWPIPTTQVAHYAGVTLGMVVVLWFCGRRHGRMTLVVVVVTGTILILTHTRTALVATVAGLLVSGLSLVVAKARVRRVFAVAGALVAIAIITVSGLITNWLARGQGDQELTNLTGRTPVWGDVLRLPRDAFQEIFGFGLSNTSANGLAIDSNWLASYQQLGLFGVIVCAAALIFLFVAAYFQPRGVRRALALFLMTYCLLASFTEVGFTDASPYLLDIAVAASLLLPSVTNR